MAKFYVYLKGFIIERNISLVLLHNDLRWQHSLAVKICKELNVKYVVTEQGMFRPNTTVIDKLGVNANSTINTIADEVFLDRESKVASLAGIKVSNDHNSLFSMFFFLMYILLSYFGRVLNTESEIVHKRHSFFHYLKLAYKLKFRSVTKSSKNYGNISHSNLVFVPLQLEDDTQILVHSEIKRNQYFIKKVEEAFTPAKCFLMVNIWLSNPIPMT